MSTKYFPTLWAPISLESQSLAPEEETNTSAGTCVYVFVCGFLELRLLVDDSCLRLHGNCCFPFTSGTGTVGGLDVLQSLPIIESCSETTIGRLMFQALSFSNVWEAPEEAEPEQNTRARAHEARYHKNQI